MSTRRRVTITEERIEMLNLVEKFMQMDLTAADDDGTVALEYVLVAGFVVVGVGVAMSTTDLWQNLQNKLDTIPL